VSATLFLVAGTLASCQPAPAGESDEVSAEATTETTSPPSSQPATPSPIEPQDDTDPRGPVTAGGDAAPQVRAGAGQCVDATLEEELLAKRKYRLTKDRLFVKNLRHELTAIGGYYVSDLFDSTFNVGASYTFFASENVGSELSFGWSRLRTTTAETIEDANNFDFQLGRNDLFRVFASLMWAPLYGKMRAGGKILRYDFYVGAGPGVVVDPLSFGMGGNFIIGARLFLHQAIAIRFDVRDYLYNQELLRERYVVNDIALNFGFSVFLPPGN
jgi:outer membrane beta-barrel protein